MPPSPPRAPPVLYAARHGTRWQKEKAAAGHGAFEYPEDAKYVGPWIIGECVGKGASGHVKIAKHRRTGQLAAVKVLPLEFAFNSHTSLRTRQAKSDKQRLGIDREIVMMKLMNHPNIMRIYDVYEGERLEAGKKSYSVSFQLQDPSQTLTDQAIDQVMQKLMQQFEKQAGALIRK